MKLRSLIPLNILKEADDEAGAGGGADAGASGNPFAGAAGEGEGGGGAEAGADASAAAGADKKGPEVKPLEIEFDPAIVRKYNKSSFQGEKGTVTTISKQGMKVQMPNGPEIFVLFKDIK